MAESRAAKKNKKRRTGKKELPAAAGFTIEEDVSVVVVAPKQPPVLEAPPDPVAELKRKIEEAKSSKDHAKAHELRQKMWVLQDTLVLGQAGPGAPKIDIQDVLPTVKKELMKKEPLVAAAPSSNDPTEKKLAKLRKKLVQIEDLKLKLERGEKLEATQIAKLNTEKEILDEVSILEELLAGVQS